MTKIITEARDWLGTPFKHQAKLKNIGCDCIGLVAGVLKNLGFDINKYYTSNYSETPDGEMLERELDTAFGVVWHCPSLQASAKQSNNSELDCFVRLRLPRNDNTIKAGEEYLCIPSPVYGGGLGRGLIQEGNIFLMKFQNQPQHVGFISVNDGIYSIIHSYKNIGKVVEHRLNQYWKSKIIKIYEVKLPLPQAGEAK
jgi:cell wall-associated NlpC family hydrolase